VEIGALVMDVPACALASTVSSAVIVSAKEAMSHRNIPERRADNGAGLG